MRCRNVVRSVAIAALAFVAVSAAGGVAVEGTFVVGGQEAGLKYARAARVALEPGKSGYALLLSARPAEGDLESWRTADPSERGSFVYAIFEPNGALWVAELGHAAAKSGRFGVVTEVAPKDFAAKGERLSGRLVTYGEQEFSDDRYTVDLKFDVALEN